MNDDARLTALENKVQELEAMVALALRLISLEKPVSALLGPPSAIHGRASIP